MDAAAPEKKPNGNRKGNLANLTGRGRPKGVPNKATVEIKALAQQYTLQAVTELARLATEAESEQARVAAIRELLDRGYGKPKQEIEHSGQIDIADRLHAARQRLEQRATIQ